VFATTATRRDTKKQIVFNSRRRQKRNIQAKKIIGAIFVVLKVTQQTIAFGTLQIKPRAKAKAKPKAKLKAKAKAKAMAKEKEKAKAKQKEEEEMATFLQAMLKKKRTTLKRQATLGKTILTKIGIPPLTYQKNPRLLIGRITIFQFLKKMKNHNLSFYEKWIQKAKLGYITTCGHTKILRSALGAITRPSRQRKEGPSASFF
jgi:hypothetical protein